MQGIQIMNMFDDGIWSRGGDEFCLAFHMLLQVCHSDRLSIFFHITEEFKYFLSYQLAMVKFIKNNITVKELRIM